MPEINNSAGAGQVVPNAGEGGGAPAPDTQNNGAPADGGAPASGDGKGEGGEGGNTPQAQKPADGAGDEPQVRQRKTVKDFIIERKEKQLEKAKAGQQTATEAQAGAGNGSGDDDEADAKDREFIIKTVEPIVKPILEKSLQEEDEGELRDFLTENPDFKPYEAKARKFMQHPTRRHLPIKSIFYEVAGDDLMKIGAERAKKAQDDEARNNAGGGAPGAGSGTPDVWGLSKEDFEKQKEQVRQNH